MAFFKESRPLTNTCFAIDAVILLSMVIYQPQSMTDLMTRVFMGLGVTVTGILTNECEKSNESIRPSSR